jgi:translation initiation factor IF-3
LKKVFINNQIKADKIRLIDEKGTQIGIVSIEEGLKIAKERGLDLIQVTDKVFPPVCKIADYGKYLYQQQKREKSGKSSGSEMKTIRLGLGISSHDLETKVFSAEKFLKHGNTVKIEMQLKGREKAHSDFAEEKIKKFIENLEKLIPIKIESGIKKNPQGLTVIIIKK